MALETIEIINSTLSLISVIVFFIVGLLITIRYFQYKSKVLLYIGIAWLIMGAPWLPSSSAFVVYITTESNLSLRAYLILGYPLIPVGLILFTAALSELKYKEKQKLIFLIFLIFGIVFEIFFLSFLIIDPEVLAKPTDSPVDVDFGDIMMIYLVVALLIVVFVGVSIARDSLKSKDLEIRLKGRFLLIAFIIFLIGAGLDAVLPIDFIALPIVRILLIASAFIFYFGFFLPKWMKKAFLKNKE